MYNKFFNFFAFVFLGGLSIVGFAEASSAQVCTPGQTIVKEVAHNEARTGDGPLFSDGEPLVRQTTFTADKGYVIVRYEFVEQRSWGKTSKRIDELAANTSIITASDVESVKRELTDYIGGKVSILDKIKIDARQRLEQLSSQYLSLSKQAATSNATLQLTLEAIPRSRKRTSDIQGFLRVNLKCVGFTNQNDLRLSLQREVDQILAKGSVSAPTSQPQQPTSSSACVSVDSRSGWQHFNLPGSFTRVASISGGWSVDTRNYSSVGPSGHSGRDAESLAPYNQYKFDQRFPFGALLMGSGQGTLWIQDSVSFNSSFGAVDMRINDGENALGDNGGSLQVCFGN